MIAPRKAAVLVGLGLLAATSVPSFATQGDSLAPLPPIEEVAAGPAAIEPAAVLSPAAPLAADPRGDAVPGATQAALTAPEAAPAAEAPLDAAPPASRPESAEIAPPDLPAVVVEVPSPDPVVGALTDLVVRGMPALHRRLSGKDRDAIAAFYALGGFEPVWVKDGAWTPAAAAVLARLARAGEDALDPSDYAVPALGRGGPASPADLARAELALSSAAVAYAHDARGARLEPARLHALMTPQLELPAADTVLAALASAPDAGAALAAYHPPHAGYRQLKAALAALRAGRPERAPARVPDGPVLRVGMQDERVPLLRARLNLPGEGAAYDEALAAAVAAFQREAGLKADGRLTRQTVAALAGPAPAGEGDLVANMERWRWLPADLGARHVFVSIPDYTMAVMEDGRPIHTARVIVGAPESPTPVFSDRMEHLIVNPSWTVPPSIMKSQFLPGLAADPSYAARRGYEVIRRGNQITVRQPPGERNALGNIKFMFPNSHAVYLHDTPNRTLFGRGARALSHGCVRVDKPLQLAEVLLGREAGWTEERLRGMIGRGERMVRLKEHVPVHLTYFTLGADERGTLRRSPDIYGYNSRVKLALGFGDDGRALVGAKPKEREAAVTAPAPAEPRRAARAQARAPRAERAASAERPAPPPQFLPLHERWGG